MALTFVNQVGAVEGMNQAAPGTLIPESFVRWSQDVLFDRAGLMRRRGPFQKFRLYNSDGTEATDVRFGSGADNERVLGVFSSYDPNGAPRIAVIVNATTGVNTDTIIRVFDNQFKLLGKETLLAGDVENLSIVSAKPALGGGLWISFAGDPADAGSQYQLFWRGGYVPTTYSAGKTGTFTTVSGVEGFSGEHGYVNPTITMSSVTGLAAGMFVFATYSGNDYYIGTIKSVNSLAGTITLEKKPFIWEPGIDNNHTVEYTVTGASWSSGIATLTVNSPVLFEIGDRVTISGINPSGYNPAGNTAVLTGVSGNTLSYAIASNPGAWVSGGLVEMDNDLLELDKTDVALKFSTVRPFIHMHGRGLMTIADPDALLVISGSAGTSAEGHWKAADVAGWNVYRASDNAFIGKVNTVTDNVTLNLVADPGLSMAADEYIMCPVEPIKISTSDNDMRVINREASEFGGLYTAVYAGYQWYGNFARDDENVNRVVFSASHDREAVDLSADSADSIIFPGKSQFRGLGSSSAGLLVFLEDRTYILRGNDRTNFSVEQLVPDGCLCPSSIVEYGGGVFWAAKAGIMFFDGASVRNLTKDNLGLYYTDSLDVFNPTTDRVIGFIHKNNLIMHYTTWKSPFDPVRYEPIYADAWQTTDAIKDRDWTEFDSDFEYDDFFTQNNTPIYWDRKILNNPEESASTGLGFKWNDGTNWESTTSIYKWGPLRKNTSMTFCLYLPTNAITTLSNLDFRGVTNIETTNGLKTIVGVNSVESSALRARLIDIHPVFDTNTNGTDDLTIEKINISYADLLKGPDFYLQTKHFTVGDPILRKWFQRVMLSMLLYDGAIRMDLVDDDDNDEVDINKKKHKYWEIFTEKGYSWDYLTDVQFPKIVSPNTPTWQRVEDALYLWDELFTSDFNRYSKRISWRKPSVGLRLYQLNNYKKPFNGVTTTPNRVEIQGFSLGFKPLRQGRV